ncbi:hypothetical protein [Streptomyces peucetius]|uniref:Uncharacterized protein n=1 Tax=Streptomyces peucetius TaxID=1950 RepID=A0ABY6I154_STRPE|nr:hypothetical protein [Streptomyces peucetius]UYQ60689.1 hypothetical protein OGH68_03900 [Streptomyces peucetius]
MRWIWCSQTGFRPCWGLVSGVVEADELDDAAFTTDSSAADRSGEAPRSAKRLLGTR